MLPERPRTPDRPRMPALTDAECSVIDHYLAVVDLVGRINPARGTGRTKKEAESQAAKSTLARLGEFFGLGLTEEERAAKEEAAAQAKAEKAAARAAEKEAAAHAKAEKASERARIKAEKEAARLQKKQG